MLLPMLKLSLILLPVLMGCSPQMNHSPESIADKNNVKKIEKPHSKPGASVSFETTTPYVLQQHAPEDVLLALLASGAEGVMDVHITVSDGLTLNSSNSAQFQLSQRGRYELSVNVTALQQGRHYINLQVVTSINKQQATRVLSAVVQVGDELQLQKNQGMTVSSAATNSAENKGVVVMPASETIIP